MDQSVGSEHFAEKTLAECQINHIGECGLPKISNFVVGYQTTKFMKVFSLETLSLYSIGLPCWKP